MTEKITNNYHRIDENILNLAWCLLVALAISEGGVKKSTVAEHLFIMRWLEIAMKRKLFPRSVAPEIQWFISEGHRLGFRAGLRAKVEYIWRTGTGDPAHLSDLRRVTNFFEAMKMLGWSDVLFDDKEWLNLKQNHASTPSIYMCRPALHASFDINESMIAPLEFKINKEFEGIYLLAIDASLNLTVAGTEANITTFKLLP